MVTKRPTGKDLRGYSKRGWWALAPQLWHSPHSVCKKSPNFLPALLPLPDLSLKQWQRAVQSCAGKGRFPGEIRPKKECINSCETCFANTLNLNDKGPSLKWVCFPKSYSPLANWPWLRISPQSSLLVIYCLILTAWQWLMSFTCIPVQNEPNKSPLRKMLLALLFERSATFPPQADHVLVDLFSSIAGGGACGRSPPTLHQIPSRQLPHSTALW